MAGEAVHDTFGRAVLVVVADDTHADVAAGLGAVEPVVHVVAGGVGSRGSGGLAKHADDLGATLGNLGDEGAVQVGVVVDHLSEGHTVDGGVEGVGVLGGGVVAPDKDILDGFNGHVLSLSDDALGTGLVEAGQGGELLLGDAGGESGGDQGVGVGGVAHDANLDGLLGDFVESLTLSLENLGVGGEEISALHTGATGSGADKDGDVAVLEADKGVRAGDDLVDQVVGTIVELHDEALKDLLGSGQLDQLKDHLLVGSEHTALRNEVAEEGADGTSGTSDGDADGFVVLGGGGEVSADALKSVHLCGVEFKGEINLIILLSLHFY